MKQKIVVCDIDGTIANDKRRKEEARGVDGQIIWENYFEDMKVLHDEPNEELKKRLIEYRTLKGLPIIFLTGRPNKLYSATMRWMFLHQIPVDLLIMRDISDTSYLNIEDFKTRKLHDILQLYDIEIAFDDLDEGIKACQNNNINCEKIEIKE